MKTSRVKRCAFQRARRNNPHETVPFTKSETLFKSQTLPRSSDVRVESDSKQEQTKSLLTSRIFFLQRRKNLFKLHENIFKFSLFRLNFQFCKTLHPGSRANKSSVDFGNKMNLIGKMLRIILSSPFKRSPLEGYNHCKISYKSSQN